MPFKPKEVIAFEQPLVTKDRNQYLKVEGRRRDMVRVACYPNRKGFDPEQGIEELEENVSTTATVIEASDQLILTNNRLVATYDGEKSAFYNNGTIILEEYSWKQSQIRHTVGIDTHISIPDEPALLLNISL